VQEVSIVNEQPFTNSDVGPATINAARCSAPSAMDDLTYFAALMARNGFTVLADRMFWNPVYARDRIALAHTSADEELRSLAVKLFRRYEITSARAATPS
jgi:hypothetical protein